LKRLNQWLQVRGLEIPFQSEIGDVVECLLEVRPATLCRSNTSIEAFDAPDALARAIASAREETDSLLAEGLTNKRIAAGLHLSPRAVENHVIESWPRPATRIALRSPPRPSCEPIPRRRAQRPGTYRPF